MKRRDLLKGLSFLPFGINALRRTPKEELKPEPVKPPEPKVTVRIPSEQNLSNYTAMSICFPPTVAGQDGWIVYEEFIPGK